MDKQTCKNCGNNDVVKYCPDCGQKLFSIDKLSSVLSDFFKTFFALDFRVFSTIKYLLFKPGFLTTEYWEGKRERYIPPMKLYLIISFLTFVILPFITEFTLGKGFLLTSSKEQEEQMPEGYSSLGFWGTERIINEVNAQYESGEITKDERDSQILVSETFKKGIDIAFERRITLDDILTQYIPIVMFLLMPFCAVLTHLVLYRRKDLYYIHHLIASVHLHSFMFLDLVLLLVFFRIFPPPLDFLAIVAPPIIYFILLFKNVYKNSWTLTVIKSVFLGPIYLAFVLFVTYIIFIVGVLYLGLIT